ncbi:MAG: GYD domain-containing protein [Armatimonadetes bacterium]|nr:GYD domain-containing protein [Armatimonadota bacterium]
MPTYVILATWTEQGIKNVKDTVKRYEAVKRMAAPMGVDIKEIYYTMGPSDALILAEAADDAAVSRVSLAAGMQGNVRTLTMRAFRKDEMAALVGGLP